MSARNIKGETMENASKALLIAGGVLLAMMIISVMLYMSTKITEMGEAQNNRKAAEQLAAFNAEYEAYNKKLLYGTDVISVINKAIEHNGGITASETDKFINIKIKVIEDFSGVTVVVKRKDGKIETTNSKSGGSGKFLKDKEYQLKADSTWATTKMDDTFIDFFTNSVPDTLPNDPDALVLQYVYTPLSEFKRAIFTCTGVGYNAETGQINELSFSQTNEATFQIEYK